MKRSTLATTSVLVGYLVVSGIIISSVAESFGLDSIAMYLTVIAVGPIGLILFATHKGLDSYLKGLDESDEIKRGRRDQSLIPPSPSIKTLIMPKETYLISGSGKVTTYNWMMKSARVSLETAQASQEGQFFNSMNVLVYSAFAMEAFFNHLGANLVENWESKERKLSKYKKLKMFIKNLDIDTDIKSEPYSIVIEVFDFRDSLAHGRTEVIEKNETLELSEDEVRSYMIGSQWMDFCTLENAERVFSCIERVITELYKAAGLGDHPFLHYHSSVYDRA